MNYYCGHPAQTRGAEQYTLHGGKGEGMHFLYVRNGLGLEAWISLDRCGDLSRITFQGDNMGYFAPCGYVAPTYYDDAGAGFLKSFTAGFLTTCGLTAVGSPCSDEGEQLPLHGTIGNTPAELCAIEEGEELVIRLRVRDARLFGRKLVLERTYRFSYTENKITLCDTVTNEADTKSPYMLLYHCNMGYPLLQESSRVLIPHNAITPRDGEAAKFLDSALAMEPPQAGFVERCYYYDIKERDGLAHAGIYSPAIGKGMVMSYDKSALSCFTEWKMMGKRDYVLGLEPGNCTPDGRDVLRKEGRLRFLAPEESGTTALTFRFVTNEKEMESCL